MQNCSYMLTIIIIVLAMILVAVVAGMVVVVVVLTVIELFMIIMTVCMWWCWCLWAWDMWNPIANVTLEVLYYRLLPCRVYVHHVSWVFSEHLKQQQCIYSWAFIISMMTRNIANGQNITATTKHWLTHKTSKLPSKHHCHHWSKKCPGSRSAPRHFLNQCLLIMD